MKILLVDDHRILLDGLKFLLLTVDSIEEVSTASTVEEGLDLLKKELPDLLISDISVPNIGGIAFAKQLKSLYPALKIIFLSMHEEPHIVKEALFTGAEGYVLKKSAHDELVKAVQEVSAGGLFFSQDIHKILLQRIRFPEDERILTAREKEVLTLIFDEFSNREIGEKLYISERTVETHRKNIYQKTKTNSLVGLLKFALENNLVKGLA